MFSAVLTVANVATWSSVAVNVAKFVRGIVIIRKKNRICRNRQTRVNIHYL